MTLTVYISGIIIVRIVTKCITSRLGKRKVSHLDGYSTLSQKQILVLWKSEKIFLNTKATNILPVSNANAPSTKEVTQSAQLLAT